MQSQQGVSCVMARRASFRSLADADELYMRSGLGVPRRASALSPESRVQNPEPEKGAVSGAHPMYRFPGAVIESYAVGILLCPAAGLKSCGNTGLDRTFQPGRGIVPLLAVPSDAPLLTHDFS